MFDQVNRGSIRTTQKEAFHPSDPTQTNQLSTPKPVEIEGQADRRTIAGTLHLQNALSTKVKQQKT